ncbi:MAG: M56 family metallopeptidase [Daejeonella sp.]
MEQNIFFSALSDSILTSLEQGLISYLTLKLLLSCVTGLRSEHRFQLYYGSLFLIFIAFIYTLISTYTTQLSELRTADYNPSLLLQSPAPENILSSLSFNTDYTKWIAGLYFTGLLIHLLIILAGLYRLRYIRNTKNLSSDTSWNERLRLLASKLHIHRNIGLHLTEKVVSPFTAGFLKPMIIFPIAMLNRLSQEQVEAILLHELAHIKRNDYLLNIIQKIMEAVLFFNPFMWLLAKDIRREREYACDDLVITHNSDTSLYAHALLHIAESGLKHTSPGISASGDEKLNLFNRIKRLTDMKTQGNNSKPGLFALLSIAAACVSLAWIIPGDNSNLKQGQSAAVEQYKPLPDNSTAEFQVPAQLHPDLQRVAKRVAMSSFQADTNKLKRSHSDAELKKHAEEMNAHAEEMKKKFDSPEWKKQMEDMKVHAEDMKKKFDSPEWKKQMEDMKVHAEDMKKKFDSPEWKKQIEDMKVHAEDMKKKFDSPEWKKQIEELKINAEEMRKKFDSPEWKKQIEDIKIQGEETKINKDEMKKQAEEMKKLEKQTDPIE